MEDFILQNIDAYGPFAVFILLMLSGIGIPLGEEVVVIMAGALIQGGELPVWLTLICAYFGVVLADYLWFILCRHFGRPILHTPVIKRMFHPRRLLEAKHQLDQRGVGMIIMARFIPGSRATAITIAGIFDMAFWKFALATASCVLITAPLQLGLGYFFAHHFGSENPAERILQLVGLMMLIIAASFAFNLWRANRRSKKRPPRARMAWLRRFRRKKNGNGH